MPHKRTKKAILSATRESVKRAMQKPSVTRSARIAQLNLDHDRISDQPTTSISGTVRKVIPARRGSNPEQIQIAVDLPETRYREIRIENSLTDEHGDEVKLKRGAQVQVTVTDDGANDGSKEVSPPQFRKRSSHGSKTTRLPT